MDYSSSINDTEHPAGPSPWGNSPAASPHVTQTTFGALGGDVPASSPAFGAAGNGFGAEHDDDYGRPRTASTVSDDDTQAGQIEDDGSDVAGRPQSSAYNDEIAYPAHAQVPLTEEAVRASQKPPQPQYKLQAKITGLERAAKKDPILRFDVHVSVPLRCPRCGALC